MADAAPTSGDNTVTDSDHDDDRHPLDHVDDLGRLPTRGPEDEEEPRDPGGD